METLRCTIKDIASKLLNNEIGAIFQGKLELGPRALGNRSIIACLLYTSDAADE